MQSNRWIVAVFPSSEKCQTTFRELHHRLRCHIQDEEVMRRRWIRLLDTEYIHHKKAASYFYHNEDETNDSYVDTG